VLMVGKNTNSGRRGDRFTSSASMRSERELIRNREPAELGSSVREPILRCRCPRTHRRRLPASSVSVQASDNGSESVAAERADQGIPLRRHQFGVHIGHANFDA